MALPTTARIEQGTKTDLRREGTVEHGATTVESRALGGGQAAQRIPGLRPATRRRAADRRKANPVPRHGLDSTPASILPTRSMV